MLRECFDDDEWPVTDVHLVTEWLTLDRALKELEGALGGRKPSKGFQARVAERRRIVQAAQERALREWTPTTIH